MTLNPRRSARSVLLLWIALFALGLSGWSLPVRAQTGAPSTTPADPDPWRFNAAPYGWVISISGSVTARGQTVDTNASFIDLVQKSQSLGGLMGYFEADKGKAGMYADFVYTNLGFGAEHTGYRNPIAGLQITDVGQRGADLQALHRRDRRRLRALPLAASRKARRPRSTG